MTSDFKTSTASTYCSPALEDAWRRFGDFDKNASLAQKRFLRQRKWITLLGVIVTALAVFAFMLENGDHWLTRAISGTLATYGQIDIEMLSRGLNIIIIIIPILISILVAGAVKFNMGISWVMLRSAAESIKHEIFRYRTQVGIYSPNYVPSRGKPETRDVALARRIKQIGKRVMETQVNMSELEIYDYKKEGLPPAYGVALGDDGFSDLTSDQYVHWRIEDQFDYYRSKAKRLAKELQLFQWSIYIIGGLGTLLAAVQMEIWVAITSALVAALGSFLEFKRVETNLIGMNLAASDLYDIRAWWRALSDAAKQQAANKAILVKGAEGIIQGENASWLTEMREALSEVYGDEEGEEGTADKDDIAVLPESVNHMSEAAASGSTAFDSVVKGEGGSWLSMMQSTLANTNGDQSTDDASESSEISPSESFDVYDDFPAEDGVLGNDVVASSETDYVDEAGYSDEIGYEESSTMSDDAMDSDEHAMYSNEVAIYGDESAVDDNEMSDAMFSSIDDSFTGDIGSDDINHDDTSVDVLNDEQRDEEPADESGADNWLDTPTTFDESLSFILEEDLPLADGEDDGTLGDEALGNQADAEADAFLSVNEDTTDDSLNRVSDLDAALQMDLPDGYEEDLKVFSDPLAEEFAPAPFQQAPGDSPEDDSEEDITAHLNDMGELVPTPFQRSPGENPELEDSEELEKSEEIEHSEEHIT